MNEDRIEFAIEALAQECARASTDWSEVIGAAVPAVIILGIAYLGFRAITS